MPNFADRLTEAIRARESALCVGIDPDPARLPGELRVEPGGRPLEEGARAIERFSIRIAELVADLAPVVKIQMAYFERFGPPGMAAARTVAERARELGLLVIGDVKRGDIGSTAAAFAESYFGESAHGGSSARAFPFDAVTLNPYLGADAIDPFLPFCRDAGAGVFVLVRTSNPSSSRIQELDCRGKPLFHEVAELVDGLGRDLVGSCGYSAVGAVVGATFPEELATARRRMPRSIFLVPGVGAQGGTARDVLAAFDSEGLGAVVNSSRGILYAHEKRAGTDWETAVRDAARELAGSLPGGRPVDA